MLAYALLAGGHLTPDPGIDRAATGEWTHAGELRWSDAVPPPRGPGQGCPAGSRAAGPMPGDGRANTQAES